MRGIRLLVYDIDGSFEKIDVAYEAGNKLVGRSLVNINWGSDLLDYTVVEHQKRYIYWGCVATDRILPILPFAVTWLDVREQLAQKEPTVDRDINFRIYKDFRALRGYQLQGLKRLQLALVDAKEDGDAELPELDDA